MSPERERAIDAAADLMAEMMSPEQAMAVVERAIVEESITVLGRASLDRMLGRLRSRLTEGTI